MSLLADIRAAGGTVGLTPEGGIRFDRVPKYLAEKMPAEKRDLIARLQLEATHGVRYIDSALYMKLDDMYRIAKRFVAVGCAVEDADRFLSILAAIDTAGWKSLAEAETVVVTHRAEAFAIVARMHRAAEGMRGLSGVELVKAIRATMPILSDNDNGHDTQGRACKIEKKKGPSAKQGVSEAASPTNRPSAGPTDSGIGIHGGDPDA